jgi:hypothetical protein
MERRDDLISIQLVEFLRRLRVALGVLSPDRKVHSVSLSNITANHSLMGNILSNLSPQLRLNLEVFQRLDIRSLLGVTRIR